MKLLYYKKKAKVVAFLYMLSTIPRVLVFTEGWPRKLLLSINYRLGEYRTWDKVATVMPCGCRGYRGHVVSYVFQCQEHWPRGK